MKMLNTAKTKNDVYKLLDCISMILRDCIARDTLLTIHEISQLDVALTSLKNIIRSNELNYEYSDVLDFEVSCFRARVVPYIDHTDGFMKKLSYEDALAEHTAVSACNNTVLDLEDIKKYKEGNLAIGQIYVNGEEMFSTKLALEHSLKCMALRWYNQLGKIKRLLGEKGVLEDVNF